MPAKAVVNVFFEIVVGGRWSDDCTLGQIKAQAYQAALLKLNVAIEKDKDITFTMKASNTLISFTEE